MKAIIKEVYSLDRDYGYKVGDKIEVEKDEVISTFWKDIGRGDYTFNTSQLSFEEEEEQKTNSALDIQEGGSHYKDMAIQPMEYCFKNNLSYPVSNVIKYISRYKNKNGLKDLEKARHCIDLLIELEYGSNE